MNASIALSSETSTAEFLMMLHLWIYALNVSPRCYTQSLTSSMDAGCLYVDLKLLVNCFVSSSVTSQDVRLEIERTQKGALHSCIENLGNFCAFK
jgi:hypothetical protein